MSIIIRIYLVLSDYLWPKKTKITDQLIESKLKFNVKKLDINFGAKLYHRLRQSDNRFQSYLPDLYSNTPLNGINYSVSYVDTSDEDIDAEEVVKSGDKPSAKPVMVLLHGMPGCITDWEEFCTEFGHKYRLIIPKFPDFELSRTSGHFWHSNEERTEFLVSFLNALSITSVDCLVCHSGGNPIALQIISGEFDGKLEVKSLVMITPPGFKWLSEYQLKNSRMMCRTASSDWRRWFFLVLMPDRVQTFFGIPETLLKNCTKDELFGMSFVAIMSGFESNCKERYEVLARKRVPTLFVMAEKDKLFPKWKYERTLEFMDANRQELFTDIGLNGELESQPTAKNWIQVLNFRFGGHFCFIKYSKVFHNQLKQFFESIPVINDHKVAIDSKL